MNTRSTKKRKNDEEGFDGVSPLRPIDKLISNGAIPFKNMKGKLDFDYDLRAYVYQTYDRSDANELRKKRVDFQEESDLHGHTVTIDFTIPDGKDRIYIVDPKTRVLIPFIFCIEGISKITSRPVSIAQNCALHLSAVFEAIGRNSHQYVSVQDWDKDNDFKLSTHCCIDKGNDDHSYEVYLHTIQVTFNIGHISSLLGTPRHVNRLVT